MRVQFLYIIVVLSILLFTAGVKVAFATETSTPIPTPTPTEVITEDATDVTLNSATLNGSVPLGTPAAFIYFEYGTTSGTYTSSVYAARDDLTDKVSAKINGLSPATTYYYRLVVLQKSASSDGYVYGTEKFFTTLEITATPIATPTTAPTPGCDADEITAFPKRLKLEKGQSGTVTVTLEGDDCIPEGITITATVGRIGSRRISVSPTSKTTDENGKAEFSIGAKEAVGNAKVRFKAGNLKKLFFVRVRR